MIALGATPQRSAFLSAFFTLVGCHGLHVTLGLVWLAVMHGPACNVGLSPGGGASNAVFRAVLARARHRLGEDIHGCLSDGSRSWLNRVEMSRREIDLRVPPAETGTSSGFVVNTIGLFLAVILTTTSFWVANTAALWAPGVAAGLAVLAIAQMGVHLVFFLHITTGPDNANNILALAFGVLIVSLVAGGSLVIMANLNENMMQHAQPMNSPM